MAKRNDPALEGTNGMLTLGFLVTMGVAFAGFLIYWVLSLRSTTRAGRPLNRATISSLLKLP